MLIGIDGNEANQAKRVGVGEYGYQVLKHLKYQIVSQKRNSLREANIKYQNFKFIIYLKEKPLLDLPKENDWWKYKVVGPKFFWTQIGLPIALFRDRPRLDVFFTPTHYAPRFSPSPRVVSIMDLSFIYFPNMFRSRDLWKLKSWTAYSVARAKKILTISKSTRNDIIKYYSVKPEKVVVTYPGVKNLKSRFSKKSSDAVTSMSNVKSEIQKLKEKYGIYGDYILYVGTLQPRKNLVRLIEAFRKLKTRFSTPRFSGEKTNDSVASNSKLAPPAPRFAKAWLRGGEKPQATHGKAKVQNLKLVIVGKKGWMFREIFEKVRVLGLEKEVIFTDYVPERELPLLYKGAKCFVLVSLYEGFGLPVLEALSFGVPVIASNTSSLPEIVGDAGVLVDPYNVNDIARGISEILQYDAAKYNSMVKRGLRQAKKFSWEKCARETLEVLMEVAKDV